MSDKKYKTVDGIMCFYLMSWRGGVTVSCTPRGAYSLLKPNPPFESAYHLCTEDEYDAVLERAHANYKPYPIRRRKKKEFVVQQSLPLNGRRYRRAVRASSRAGRSNWLGRQ